MRKILSLLTISMLGLAYSRLASGGGGYISATGVATPVSVANGGTGTSTALPAGAVVFAGTGGTYTGISTFAVVGSSVGIGTSSPQTLLDVNGGVTIRSQETVTSSLTVAGSAFSVAATTLVVTGGNVGINVASPLGVLDMVPPNGSTSWMYFRGNSNGTLPSTSYTTGLAMGWNRSAGSGETNLVFGSGAGTNPALEIDEWTGSILRRDVTITSPNGYMGIGINNTTPATQLDVQGAITCRGQETITSTLTVQGATFSIGVSTLATSAGSVGIGTSSPGTKLHMSSGTLTIDGNVSPAIDVLNGLTGLWSRTRAQIDGITPTRAGQALYCSDCTSAAMCVSTGTTLSGFKRSDSTTAGCGTGN